MNLIGLALSFMGLVILIYSFISRKRVNYYNRGNGFELLNEDGFFKIQFKFMIFNSVCMIIFGVVVVLLNYDDYFIFIYLLIFHLVNFIFKQVAKKKKYIVYK